MSGSLDTNVYIWSTQNVGKYIAIKGASKDGVWGVNWIGDKKIASTGGDAAIKIWDSHHLAFISHNSFHIDEVLHLKA